MAAIEVSRTAKRDDTYSYIISLTETDPIVRSLASMYSNHQKLKSTLLCSYFDA